MFKVTREKAIKKLEKLEKERMKLLRIINGHIIEDTDIEHGILISDPSGMTYKIIEKGFGYYNMLAMNDYYQSEKLTEHLTAKDLAELLNKNNFKVMDNRYE